jgi:macrodomain Ter protein organizer (MatP/YcbG family)
VWNKLSDNARTTRIYSESVKNDAAPQHLIDRFFKVWNKLSDHATATSGFTLGKAIACAVEFDDQVNGLCLFFF